MYYVDVIDVFKGMVDILFVDIQQDIFNWFVVVIWVNVVGSIEVMSQIEFFWVGIDSDNLFCFCLMCVLNYCQINCVKIKYGNRIIWLDFSCVVYCVNIGGYVIVQQVDVFMVCFWINFGQRYFCDYGVFIEC